MGCVKRWLIRGFALAAVALVSTIYFLGLEMAIYGIVVAYGIVLSVILAVMFLAGCAFVIFPASRIDVLSRDRNVVIAFAVCSVVLGVLIAQRLAIFFSF